MRGDWRLYQFGLRRDDRHLMLVSERWGFRGEPADWLGWWVRASWLVPGVSTVGRLRWWWSPGQHAGWPMEVRFVLWHRPCGSVVLNWAAAHRGVSLDGVGGWCMPSR